MTRTQRHTLRLSECRQRLREIADLEGESFSDEVRQEADKLTVEVREVETKLRASIASEPDAPTPGNAEVRERASLVAGASLGAIFAAAIEKRVPAGETAELQAELGLGPNQIPLSLLRLPVEEMRAVTPAPTNTGASIEPVVAPVFAMGDAAFLGIHMPTVPSGDAVFPVLTTRPSVGGPHTDSTSVAETTGAFSAEALSPSRLQASFFYRRTDAARFAEMDSALRMALSEALSEANDTQIVNQIVTDVSRTDATAVDTFASYRNKLVFARVDGRFATMGSEIRALVGAGTYAHMASVYRADETDMTALGAIMADSGGIRVSPHIAAVASNQQDTIIRRGRRRDMVAPMWEGVTLIPDEVTRAGTGEIVITAVALCARKVVRAAGFARIETQHA